MSGSWRNRSNDLHLTTEQAPKTVTSWWLAPGLTRQGFYQLVEARWPTQPDSEGTAFLLERDRRLRAGIRI